MSEESLWLSADQVLAMHDRAIELFGGSFGLRDENGLLGALNRPEMAVHYSDPTPTVFVLGALYAHGIAKAHAFVDGNKRTAFSPAMLFLCLNGIRIDLSVDSATDLMVRLATDHITVEDFASALKSRSPGQGWQVGHVAN